MHRNYTSAKKKYSDLKKRVRVEEDKFYSRKLGLRKSGDTQRLHAAVRQRNTVKYIIDRIERLVDDHGVAYHSDREILAIMTDYVANLYEGEGLVTMDDLILDEEEFPSYDSLCDSEINREEVEIALKKTQLRRAVGLDNLYAEMFIGATPEEAECFTAAVESIFGNSYPSAWKTDRKKPIPKARAASNTSNYRMIGIQSSPRKLFNTILRNLLEQIMDLEPWQSGFRKGRRISDNVHALTDVLKFHHYQRRLRDKPEGIYVAVFTSARRLTAYISQHSSKSSGQKKWAARCCTLLNQCFLTQHPVSK